MRFLRSAFHSFVDHCPNFETWQATRTGRVRSPFPSVRSSSGPRLFGNSRRPHDDVAASWTVRLSKPDPSGFERSPAFRRSRPRGSPGASKTKVRFSKSRPPGGSASGRPQTPGRIPGWDVRGFGRGHATRPGCFGFRRMPGSPGGRRDLDRRTVAPSAVRGTRQTCRRRRLDRPGHRVRGWDRPCRSAPRLPSGTRPGRSVSTPASCRAGSASACQDPGGRGGLDEPPAPV